MADFIVIIILLVLVSSAVYYLVKAKKRGQTCIGCPNASSCSRCEHCKENGKSYTEEYEIIND